MGGEDREIQPLVKDRPVEFNMMSNNQFKVKTSGKSPIFKVKSKITSYTFHY